MFNKLQLNVIAFCAEECTRQQSGELSVGWMLNAYNYASKVLQFEEEITQSFPLSLARMIEPFKNAYGYRIVPVSIRGNLKDNQELITRQMEMLLSAQTNLTPEEFYKEFEEIHPFVDGNGRVGVILYNYLNKTMNIPSFAPDYWSVDEEYNRLTAGDNSDRF